MASVWLPRTISVPSNAPGAKLTNVVIRRYIELIFLQPIYSERVMEGG